MVRAHPMPKTDAQNEVRMPRNNSGTLPLISLGLKPKRPMRSRRSRRRYPVSSAVSVRGTPTRDSTAGAMQCR